MGKRPEMKESTGGDEPMFDHRERRFRALFEQAAVGMGEVNAEGRIAAVNNQFCRITGYSREELLGMEDPAGALAHPEDLEAIRANLRQVMRGERDSYQAERRYRRKDGQTVWLRVTTSVIRDEAGRFERLLGIVEDISERKEAEIAQARLAGVVHSSDNAILTKTLEGTITSWNPGAERLYGYTAEEAIGRPVTLIVPDDRLDEIPQIMERLRRGERIEHYETVRQRKDGTLRDISLTVSPLHDAQGRIVEALAIGRDITERKGAEEALAESEQRKRARADELEALMDAVPAVVFLAHDPEGRRITGSRTAHELLRVRPGANLSKNAPEGERPVHFRVYQDGRELAPHELPVQRAARGEEVWGEELEQRFGDGTVLWLYGNARPLRDDAGRVRGAVAAFVDVTERKRSEQAMRRAWAEAEEGRNVLEAMMEHIPMGITMADAPDVRIRTVSRYGCDLLDQPRERLEDIPAELHAQRWQIFKTDGETLAPNEELPLTRAIQRGETVPEEEWVLVRRDGTQFPVLCTAAPIRDANGHITGGVIGWQDITERKQIQERLEWMNHALEQRVAERTAIGNRRAEKLQSLTAQLTQAEQRERRRIAQILHDHLQQILVAVKMQVGLLGGRDPNSIDRVAGQLKDLLDEAINSARSLSHELCPPVLYEQGLAAALHWLGRRFGEQHGLVVEVDAEAGAEPEDRDLQAFLFQSVHELLLNAIKHGAAERAWVTARQQQGVLAICVEDDGGGCEPDQLFDKSGEDEGFGIFSIQERLNLLDGSVDTRAAPGEGCCVTLRLAVGAVGSDPAPLGMRAPAKAGQGSADRGAEEPPEDSRDRPTRVMLVDDHRIVREGLAGILRGEPDIELVAEAADGREAVERVEEIRPDVIVMDVSMPRMDGEEATRLILDRHPEIRILGLSMHQREDLAQAMRRAGASVCLSKQSAATQLVSTIREHAELQHSGPGEAGPPSAQI